MVASVLQLTSVGLQDVYLTKDPEISMFKYSYYRYVNFATELVRVNLNDTPDFGRTNSCIIPSKGHLLSKLFLRIRLPQLTKNGGQYLSWTDTIGYAIFKDGVDLEIGGVVVDTFYPQFWDIYEAFTSPDDNLGANLMILRGDTFVSARSNAEKENDLIIPLKFWFTRAYNLALPLLSMPYQSIKIKFKTRAFQECINYDGDAPSDESMITSEVFAEYVYLDNVILEKFQQQKHEYLIEQIQSNTENVILSNEGTYSVPLVFNNPCKELVFACVETANISSNNYFNYSSISSNDNMISEVGLTLDGQERYAYTPEVFFRLAYPSILHRATPLKFVYCLPFCIKPEDNQPTGTINMSRFDSVNMTFKMIKNNPECMLYVYSVMYNVVTVENGILSFKFNW
jgi:hypothetical protein